MYAMTGLGVRPRIDLSAATRARIALAEIATGSATFGQFGEKRFLGGP